MSDGERLGEQDWDIHLINNAGTALFKSRRQQSVLEVKPIGEADIYMTPSIKEFTDEEMEADEDLAILHVDLTETKFVGSVFLGYFVGMLKRLREREGNIYVTADDQNIKKVFEITGLDRVFEIRSSDDSYDWEAIAKETADRKDEARAAQAAAPVVPLSAEADEVYIPRRNPTPRPSEVLVLQKIHAGVSIEVNGSGAGLANALRRVAEAASSDEDVASITFYFPFSHPLHESAMAAMKDAIRISLQSGKGTRISLGQNRQDDSHLPQQYAELLRGTGQLQ